MPQMDPDMPDPEDGDREDQPYIEPVDSEKKKSGHRERRAGG